MNCRKCGASLSIMDKVCGVCGANVYESVPNNNVGGNSVQSQTSNVPSQNAAPTPSMPNQNVAPVPGMPNQNAAPTPSMPSQNAAPVPGMPSQNAAPAPGMPSQNAAPAPSIPNQDAEPKPTMSFANIMAPQSTPEPIKKEKSNTPVILTVILLFILVAGGVVSYLIFFNKEKSILEKNVRIVGYVLNTNESLFNIVSEGQNVPKDYIFEAENVQLFAAIIRYQDDVNLDIYYIEEDNQKKIISYEVYDKATNRKLSNINDENELRSAIGYYAEGNYEEVLTLTSFSEEPVEDFDYEYNYIAFYSCVFLNDSGKKIATIYAIEDQESYDASLFKENQKYNVTFSCEKYGIDYEYKITSITPIS